MHDTLVALNVVLHIPIYKMYKNQQPSTTGNQNIMHVFLSCLYIFFNETPILDVGIRTTHENSSSSTERCMYHHYLSDYLTIFDIRLLTWGTLVKTWLHSECDYISKLVMLSIFYEENYYSRYSCCLKILRLTCKCRTIITLNLWMRVP